MARHPEGGLPGRGDAAAEAVTLLAEGWAWTLLHALAARPRTTAELEEELEGTDGKVLEDRLAAMRRLGMLRRLPGERGQGVHAVTDWLREAAAPLVVAARGERRLADAAPIEALDVTAAFQLAVPLLRLPASGGGACALAVALDSGLASVTARFERGRATSCQPSAEPGVDAACRGDLSGWFLAVIDGDIRQTETSGDHGLARTVLVGLHERLFDGEPRTGG